MTTEYFQAVREWSSSSKKGEEGLRSEDDSFHFGQFSSKYPDEDFEGGEIWLLA